MFERNVAIDSLKFLAVMFIFNAHSTVLYPVCPWLATGGYVGDALFFFCSGYTLLLNGRPLGRFDAWYKRRLCRILPSCLAWGVVSSVVFRAPLPVIEVFTGVGWFVSCILVYYVIIWIVGTFCIRWIRGILVASVVVCGVALALVLYYKDLNPNHWKWFFFFPVMLLGTELGRVNSKPRGAFCLYAILAIIAFALFTGVIAAGSRITTIPYIRYLQILGMPLLLVFVYFAYFVANSSKLLLLQRTKVWRVVVNVGGLCLDFYLVKWSFISGAFNFLFPLNLLIMLVYLLAIAYCNRSLGRIIQQTVERGKLPYDWRSVFSLS